MDLAQLKKIDSKKIIKVIKDNYDKDAAMFTVVFVLILFVGIKQAIIPAFENINKNLSRGNQKQEELKRYSLTMLNAPTQKEQKRVEDLPVQVYQSPSAGLDTESASAELVQEIIRIIKQTGNTRVNQADFTAEDVKDESGASTASYGILSLNLSLEGSYESVQNMLNEIYLMNYLIVIKSVESQPTEDFHNIITNVVLKIYVKLD
jgi:hypothetical protein